MIDHIPLEDLSALLDGALPPARQAQVEAHLSTCEACREEFESLSWADRFMAAAPEVEIPASETFHIPVEDSDEESEAGPLLMPRFDRSWLGLGAIAAMVTIAFLLGQLTGNGRYSAMDIGDDGAAEMAMEVEEAAFSVDHFDADTMDEAVAEEGEADASVAFDSVADAVGESADDAASNDTADEEEADREEEPLLPIDAAAKQARERIDEGDDAEERVEPLGTAIRADRGGLVAGDDASAPPAELVLGTPEDLEGGYKPPGGEIPGVISARDLRQIEPITATQIAAAVATAELVLTQSPPTPDAPAQAAQATVNAARIYVTPPVFTSGDATIATPELPAAPAAMGASSAAEDAESADEEEAAEAEDGAEDDTSEAMKDPAGATSIAPRKALQFGSERLADAVSEGSADGTAESPEAAPRALILPLAAVSVGLLALGLLLWRQAGRRRRRHRDRIRDR